MYEILKRLNLYWNTLRQKNLYSKIKGDTKKLI